MVKKKLQRRKTSITLGDVMVHMRGMEKRLSARIDGVETGLGKRLEKVEVRLEKVEGRLEKVEDNLDILTRRVDALNEDLTATIDPLRNITKTA